MFFDTSSSQNKLQYNPFKACVVPRPIAWISSINESGIVNIGPYSYFNAVSDIPPVIMFSSGYKKDNLLKDSIRNIEKTKEFVVNIVTEDLAQIMQDTSAELEYGISEADIFNIEMSSSNLVNPPRIKRSPINLECRYINTIDLEVDNKPISSKLIFGHVVGINIDDSIITDGKVDILKLKPVTRLGYNQYSVIDSFFTLQKK